MRRSSSVLSRAAVALTPHRLTLAALLRREIGLALVLQLAPFREDGVPFDRLGHLVDGLTVASVSLRHSRTSRDSLRRRKRSRERRGRVARHTKRMRILAISDVVDEAISASLPAHSGSIDLVIGCGDLPYEYLDYVATTVSAPLRAVHGNHDVPLAQVDDPAIRVWWNGIDLHRRVVNHGGVLIAGLEGSPVYSQGPYQYTETGMWLSLLRLVPALLFNRLRHGRFLDVLVTHAPPRAVHDESDKAHRGFECLRWFIREFQPRFHLHGHTHVYDSRTSTITRVGRTTVVNAYGATTIEV